MKSIDIFTYPILLTYKRKHTYKTVFGGYVSLMIILLIIFSIVYFGQDLYLRTNPMINVQEESESTQPVAVINSEDYVIALNFNFLPHEEIEKKLTFLATTQDMKPIDIKPCEVVYADKVKAFEMPYEMYGSYCLSNYSHPLNGTFFDFKSRYIALYIHVCQNTTENNNHCYPYEMIEAEFRKTIVSIMYYDNLLMSFNYTNPIKKELVSFYSILDFSMFYSYQITYKNVTVETDDGWVFPSKKIEKNIMIDGIFPSFGVLKNEEEVRQMGLVQFQILLINKHVKVLRNYVRVQNVFANLGGIIKFLIMFGNILVHFFADKVYHIDLANSFYDFDESNHPQQRMRKDNTPRLDNSKVFQISSNDPGKQSNNDFSSSRKLNTVNLIKMNINSNEFFKNRNKETLIFTSCEVFKISLCKKYSQRNHALAKKQKLLSQASHLIRDKMDLMFFFKHFREFDLLKSILLEEHQIILLDYIRKPKLNPQEDKIKAQYSNVSKLYNYYMSKKPEEMGRVDLKLYDLLDKNLELIFLNN